MTDQFVEVINHICKAVELLAVSVAHEAGIATLTKVAEELAKAKDMAENLAGRYADV